MEGLGSNYRDSKFLVDLEAKIEIFLRNAIQNRAMRKGYVFT